MEDARDARRAADVIGIPFYVWDMAERFDRDVVADFVAEYAAGRTPNPCLRCNEKIKFAAVLDRALALGFDAVCTGHHARLRDGRLVRSVDQGKDQSYVLAVLSREQLGRAMFPLGSSTKAQVRAEAAARGMAVASKPDSHDVCFIPDGDTRAFLAGRLGDAPGPIVTQDGTPVGTHDGAFGFTVGQRKGLRVGVPAGDGRPRYVLDIEPVSRTVTVGPRESLDVQGDPGRAAGVERVRAAARTAGVPGPVAGPRRGPPGHRRRWTPGTRSGSRWTSRPGAWPGARPRSCTTATRCWAAARSAVPAPGRLPRRNPPADLGGDPPADLGGNRPVATRRSLDALARAGPPAHASRKSCVPNVTITAHDGRDHGNHGRIVSALVHCGAEASKCSPKVHPLLQVGKASSVANQRRG